MQMKDVIISVTGMQETPEGPDSTELVTAGTYGYSPEEITMSWQESELTGLEGTKTTLSLKNGTATLTREGALNSTMEFREGERNFFLYETPFGSATMGLNTRRMRNNLNAHGGEMLVEYVIDWEESIVGRNRFYIRVQEPKKSHTGDIKWPI